MKPFRTAIAFLLAAVFLVGLVPAATAADGDAVLTSIGHSDTDTVAVSDPSAMVTLTVFDRFPGAAVDLSNDLTITFDTTRYKLAVASVSGISTVDGAPVTVTVTFNNISDAVGAAKSVTIYQVQVARAAAVSPSFTGTVTKEVLSPNSIVLSSADFTPNYTVNDGVPLGYISLNGSNPAFGSMKYAGTPYVFDTPVTLATVNQLTFSAVSNGTVSYDVTAYTISDSVTPIGNVVLTIVAYATPTISSPVIQTVAKGAVIPTGLPFFAGHCDLNGVPLVSLEITAANTPAGTWYLGTTSFTGIKTILAANLGNLSFMATAPGTATFNWRVSNKAGFSSSGTGVITVISQLLTLTPYTAAAPILKGGTYALSPTDFTYTPASAVMTYIKLTAIPTATDGILYLTTALPKNDTYGYPALAANTALASNAVIPVAWLGYLRLATKTTSVNDLTSFKWSATADLKITSSTWAEPVTNTVNFVTGGTLAYSADMNIPLPLPATDLGTRFATMTGTPLSYVTFILPDKNTGNLYLSYDTVTKKGTAVTASTKYYQGKNPNLANITFVPAPDFIGTSTFKYTAYADSGVLIAGTIIITVQNTPGGTINLQMDKNSTLQFDAAAFQASFLAATGKNLYSAAFSVLSSTYGALYYDYSSGDYTAAVYSGNIYYVNSSPYLSMVTFVPATDYTGNVAIYFTGYTSAGALYTCKIVISVVDSPGGIVSYPLKQNGYTAILGQDFSKEFVSVTGSILSYVTFTPPVATSGTMYYQYDADTKKGTAVSASSKYYDGKSPDLADITFVPAKDFTGIVVVPYKAFNAAGAVYMGKLKFIVSETSSLISYSVLAGQAVTMDAGDFVSAFDVLSTGNTLSYVTFELPSSSYGRLYYSYYTSSNYDSAVAAGKKYSVGAAPYLSAVTFVPANGFSGSVTLTYTGYAADGTSYAGKVRITVASAANGTVSYSTNSLTPVTFRSADFISAYASTGTLSYVVFSLPSSNYGTLYYGYSSADSPGSAVTTYTPFYPGGYPYISSITFIPNSGFSGSLAIGYTAYGTSGVATSGTVVITVSSSDVNTVTYATSFNTPLVFNAEDFNTAFLNKTGSSLGDVVFALPPAEQGQLFLGYTSPTAYTSAVTSGVKYYRSYSPRLSDVSFVPKNGYVGTVTVSYVGHTVGGAAYTGKVMISVGASIPFADMKTGYDWAAPAVAYLYTNGIVKGADDGKFHPADYVSRGDFILMVTRAFGLNSYSADNFADVPLGIYYYSAVATAKYYGIVNGSGGKFYPSAYISRQDAMVIIARALDATGLPIAQGVMDDLSAFSDTSQISDYAVTAMASLVKAGIITGSGGKLSPKSMITRAEMSVILYKVLTM